MNKGRLETHLLHVWLVWCDWRQEAVDLLMRLLPPVGMGTMATVSKTHTSIVTAHPQYITHILCQLVWCFFYHKHNVVSCRYYIPNTLAHNKPDNTLAQRIIKCH